MSTVTPLPFDPTGAAPTNKVVNEQQVITAVNFRDYHYVIPNLAPFFSDTVVMTAKNPDGSNHPLTEGVDYYFSPKWSVFTEYKFLDYTNAGGDFNKNNVGQHLVGSGFRFHF